jgi:hypothetical protein
MGEVGHFSSPERGNRDGAPAVGAKKGYGLDSSLGEVGSKAQDNLPTRFQRRGNKRGVIDEENKIERYMGRSLLTILSELGTYVTTPATQPFPNCSKLQNYHVS